MAAQIPGGPLSAANLAYLMLQSLPQSEQIKTQAEALGLLAHACFLAIDFRLIGLDEDHRIGREFLSHFIYYVLTQCLESSAESTTQSSSESIKFLPPEWNRTQNISFKYAHDQSSMHFLLTIRRMGTKVVINALALGDEKVASLDVPMNDFISSSSLPSTLPNDRTSVDASHDIQEIFISAGRIADFASMLKVQIFQKLMPKMQKQGYEETTRTSTAGTRAEEASRNRNQRQDIDDRERAPPGRFQDPLPPAALPRPFNDPLADIPRRGPIPDFEPPGFEDEHGTLRPPGRGGFGGGGFQGPSYGERDLYPPGLGPHDPLRIGPGSGGLRGGGGMHPSFDDPLFGGDRSGGFNPMAPPGARYDPVGPGDGVPRDPGAGRRFPSSGQGNFRGGPSNPFGGFGSGDFI